MTFPKYICLPFSTTMFHTQHSNDNSDNYGK